MQSKKYLCLNDWFAALPEGRQAVLRADKWMLAEAAFEAGRASAPENVAPAAPMSIVAWRVCAAFGDRLNRSDWIDGAPEEETLQDFRTNAPSMWMEYAYATPQPPAAPGEQDARDAMRYRWLRDVGNATWRPFGIREGYSAAAADAAIDAAMAAHGQEGSAR